MTQAWEGFPQRLSSKAYTISHDIAYVVKVVGMRRIQLFMAKSNSYMHRPVMS